MQVNVSRLKIHNEIVQSQREDPAFGELIKLKNQSAVLSNEVRKGASDPVRKLMHEWLHIKNKLLYRTVREQQQFIQTSQYNPLVLLQLHDDMGHFGANNLFCAWCN